MKGIILCSLLSVFVYYNILAQSTLPNTGFEEWTQFELYEEPSGGVWTTANRAILLNEEVFKVTTFKTTDAYAGSYAAKIITDLADLPDPSPDLLQAGALATGVFDELAPPPANLKTGTPFTARPVSFKGYYKYISVEHDSLDMWAILTKWNTETNHQDTVGVAWVTDSTLVPEYTLFNIPMIYYSDEEPDSIHVVFSPSAGGDFFLGQVGSELYIDEISLEMENGIDLLLMPEISVKTFPNPASDKVYFSISDVLKDGEVKIYDLSGKEILSHKFKGNQVEIDLSGYIQGTYFYSFIEKRQIVNSGSFMVAGK